MRQRAGRVLKLYAVLLTVLCAAHVTRVYAASNGLEDNGFGGGSGTVSGYSISNVHYETAPVDRRYIKAVAFSLNEMPATPLEIHVHFGTEGAWYSCSHAGTAVTCPVASGVPVATTEDLGIVITQ